MAIEYEPLLDAGVHPMAAADMKPILVDSFTDRKGRRAYLVSRLHAFLEDLVQLIGTTFKVWVDGSLLSSKPEPADVDLVVIVEGSHLNALSVQEKSALREIFVTERQHVKQRYSCDVYLMLADNADQEQYWRELFGHDREGRPKGIIEVGCNGC
ncbi:hypothetical protein J7355_17015 [Endozoicomonas sp. G2_2]|uniref:DUF6932 family protein n=1 Tax=Endozoicomonas sp. G2_2 TaxID=2821092 RepID=UPI001ADADA5F|nr:hypothetical protein [Endozoicomonas sp. G2_2]MBO9471795.1 hypothetical protein [Endozoicomonas sp. G2_2]